jgi:hypothetical protein
MDELEGLVLVFIAFPGTDVVEGADLATHAVQYANSGWAVFPLRGKYPMLTCPINAEYKRQGLTERCPGGCGNDGHGVLDATTDMATIARWWTAYPESNIGGRVPEGLVVIDTDPRHGGEDNLQLLAADHGGLLETLTAFSGRGDGGRHRYFRHPGGEVSGSRLPEGVDVKTSSAYVVLPPSIHPDSGQPYRWEDERAVPAEVPQWLASGLRPEVRPAVARTAAITSPRDGDSIADWYCNTATWADVLVGWRLVSGDGERDGSTWRHPTATSASSATIRHNTLFVYSSNTPFEVTEAGSPHGYTKFRAYAVLEHGSDLSAAARAAVAIRGRTA